MANQEQLEILKQGVKSWNMWRKQHPDIRIDLREAQFHSMDLCAIDLHKADLRGTSFVGSELINANFYHAILEGADLSETELSATVFTRAYLNDTNFNRAWLTSTLFNDVDLSKAKGLENVTHYAPSHVGFDTIQKSGGKIPVSFLRGCGVSEYEIKMGNLLKLGMDRDEVTEIAYDLVNLYCGDAIQFHSCFISYNKHDEEFAQRLYGDLQEEGVRCWFAPHSMRIGDRIRVRIDQEIRLRDKLLVILSKNSIASEWVGDEVETALEEESFEKRTIIFPVRLDDAVMDVRSDWAAKIRRRRHIGDFSNWESSWAYDAAFKRLLQDLKVRTDPSDDTDDANSLRLRYGTI